MDAEQRKKLRERLAQHSPSAENALMNFSEHARAEGREEGREEGRDEGREEGQVLGQRATLIKLLQLKFGVLPAEITVRLENGSPEELDRWTEAVLSASSLEAVFG
jgi:flagellar biosynthesis/type III secretory pathway protein FliH